MQFEKIHRSKFQKIKDISHMMSICEKKCSVEVRLVHAKDISLSEFRHFVKKE